MCCFKVYWFHHIYTSCILYEVICEVQYIKYIELYMSIYNLLLFRKQLVLTTCLVATINFNFTMIVYCAIYCWLFLFKTSNYFLCTIYISHLLLLTQRYIYDLQDKILAVHWILILLWNGPISHVSGLDMAIHYFMPYSCICKLWWRWYSYIHI